MREWHRFSWGDWCLAFVTYLFHELQVDFFVFYCEKKASTIIHVNQIYRITGKRKEERYSCTQ